MFMKAAIFIVKVILGICFLGITAAVGVLFLIPITMMSFKREAVKIRSTFGEYGEAATLLQEALLKSKDDTDLKKMLTANYIAQKDYAKALEIADAIAQKTKQKEDYDMAGSISYLLGDYKKASGYFRSSYAIRADDISV